MAYIEENEVEADGSAEEVKPVNITLEAEYITVLNTGRGMHTIVAFKAKQESIKAINACFVDDRVVNFILKDESGEFVSPYSFMLNRVHVARPHTNEHLILHVVKVAA